MVETANRRMRAEQKKTTMRLTLVERHDVAQAVTRADSDGNPDADALTRLVRHRDQVAEKRKANRNQ